MKKIAIIYNENSGANNRMTELTDAIELLPSDQFSFEFVKFENNTIERQIKDLIEQKFDIIAAAGGDGTLSAVGKNLINTNISSEYFPLAHLITWPKI